MTLPAWIPRGNSPVPCTVANVSQDGAQLCISMNFALPDRFILLFTPDGKIKRACLVVWRKGDRTGVRFCPLPTLAVV
jgi:PilZ domain-containing protein